MYKILCCNLHLLKYSPIVYVRFINYIKYTVKVNYIIIKINNKDLPNLKTDGILLQCT